MQKDTIYIDSNIIMAEGRRLIKIDKKKINGRKEGTISRLSEKYRLLTSILSKLEVIKNLKEKEQIPLSKARSTYFKIINSFKIVEVTFIDFNPIITHHFIEDLLKANIDLKDGIHIKVAEKCKLTMVTGDKKDIAKMRKLYSEVMAPNEILN